MHELGIARNIVAIIEEHSHTRRVKKAILHIGKLSMVMVDSLKFCLDVCTEKTALAGLPIDIVEIAGKGKCSQCSYVFSMKKIYGVCPKCSQKRIQLIAGQELKVHQLEFESQ